jgi:tetratricopeptide (TPR) repeat protein
MAALALIKQGEALRMELHYRPASVSQDDLKAQINLAKESYLRAFQKAQGDPSLAAMAKYGLGLCEEELGNFQEAEKIYREFAADPQFEGTATAAAVKFRLETMAEYKEPVAFEPAPQPAVRQTESVIEPNLPSASKVIE